MPTQTIGDSIHFYYTDSGAPAEPNYATLFIIHGHTFHSGTFSRISSVAPSRGLRIICVNRREYPGSSPYSTEESKIINEGSTVERTKFMLEQGVHLCLLVDSLIETLTLHGKGGITISGWSLGASFAIAMLVAISDLPEDTRNRLKTYVHKVILWDPPSVCIGTKGPADSYVPLFDNSLPPEARGPTFGVWVSSYFKHGDLHSRDFNKLNQRDPDPARQATILKMTPEEIGAIIDFVPGAKYDTAMVTPSFATVHWDQTNKALFDPACREQWGGFDVYHMYGDANCWPILHAVWSLEKRMKGKEIHFKRVEGANHFSMWEEPEETIRQLKDCIKGNTYLN